MKWSRYIAHNGKPVPHLVGRKVETLTDCGHISQPRITTGTGHSWVWTPGLYTHIAAYRVMLWEGETLESIKAKKSGGISREIARVLARVHKRLRRNEPQRVRSAWSAKGMRALSNIVYGRFTQNSLKG